MATITGKHVLLNAKLMIDSLDASDHTKSVDQDMSNDSVEVTAMGNINHTYAPGLGNSKLSGELYQDYATSSIDEVLSDLVLNKEIVTCYVQPDNDTVSANNPKYSNTYFVSKYKGVSGSVGAAHMTPFELSPTGDLERLITP